MPNRCARCGAFAGRGREIELPADWLSYLRSERGISEPVGTVKLPLCADCANDIEAIREEGTEGEHTELLQAIDTSLLIDDH